MNFDRDKFKSQIHRLASLGAFIGTSSWKYPGWHGKVFDESRYVWHGRYSKARFERLCLAEYAEVFKTVCVDAAYYHYPDRRSLETLAALVPSDFQFAFKVTDEITLKRFPELPRFGARAGTLNPHFLDAERFASAFLEPCESIKPLIGLLIFEFSRFPAGDFPRGRDFVAALDAFLGQIPSGWPCAVEIRNRTFLHPDYFAALARHGAAHVFNSWTDMPPVKDQMAVAGSQPNSSLLAARFLLKPGRKYEEAVKLFQPYEAAQEHDPGGRAAGAELLARALAAARTRAFIYVNNRFEGCAPDTIAGMLDLAGV